MHPAPARTTEAYETDHDPTTLTFCAGGTTLALPYHLLRALHLRDGSIVLSYSDYEITVRGTALGKLWRELCAYRVKEVAVTMGGATSPPGNGASHCRVGAITVSRTGEEPEG